MKKSLYFYIIMVIVASNASCIQAITVDEHTRMLANNNEYLALYCSHQSEQKIPLIAYSCRGYVGQCMQAEENFRPIIGEFCPNIAGTPPQFKRIRAVGYGYVSCGGDVICKNKLGDGWSFHSITRGIDLGTLRMLNPNIYIVD